MKYSRGLVALVILSTAVVSFFLGWQLNGSTRVEAQGRAFQHYKVLKLDASVGPLVLNDQINQYADQGYRYRDMRDGLIILEYSSDKR